MSTEALGHIGSDGAVEFIRWIGRTGRVPHLRTLSQFSEQEIRIPTGPYQGRRFKLDRHPAGKLLFAELDSGRWRRVFITGPNQDGKSLLGFVIPTMYALFERQESVVLGVPSLEMVADKWGEDLQPVIAASRYKDQLPTTGKGSRDGECIAYRFDRATLRFMTAGGNDQSRSSFTTRNLHVTETEGFDRAGAASAEGSKFSQLERRTLAFAGMGDRLIAEATLSFEKGRTWQEYKRGTQSRIVLPCQHCKAWVTPEREHFHGWQNADTKLEAISKARIHCPSCGSEWSNDDRLAANKLGVLAHRGQSVDEGVVSGPVPDTDTLGFRWTVVNTTLNPQRLATVGGAEWDAKRTTGDEELVERELRQSHWALPAKPLKQDVSSLDAALISKRTRKLGRGVCPEGTQFITVGCDVGKYRCHWMAIAWCPGATPHVIDYGVIEVNQESNAEGEIVERQILSALCEWRDEVARIGWPIGQAIKPPVLCFVDSGNWATTIYRFCAESGPEWFATKGFGFEQRASGRKRDTGSTVEWTGQNYNGVRLPTGFLYIEIEADYWKTWLHNRLHTTTDQPGAMTLFEGRDHYTFAKHLTAEIQEEEFTPRYGVVRRWVVKSRNNHFLDATAMACVAGHAAGARLPEEVLPQPPQATPTPTTNASNPLSYRGRW